MAKWSRIAALRSAVNGALEQARADKVIGKSLEAAVALTVPQEDAFLQEMDEDALADLFIVSQVQLTVGDEVKVAVKSAEGTKCGRCWKVLHSVKAVGEHEALCPRCAAVMAKLPKVE